LKKIINYSEQSGLVHGCVETDEGGSRRQLKNKYDAEQISSVLEFLCLLSFFKKCEAFIETNKNIINEIKESEKMHLKINPVGLVT